MGTVAKKRILLGVCGGIAAYKAAELTRLLRTADAQVRVVMTRAATQFVTPLTFQALSGERVATELLDLDAEASMGHIELARWADAVLVAPATANMLAKLAHGHADDLLSTLCLATRAPLAVAPAMNQAMWDHPATQANVARLRERGVHIVGPASGVQACGEVGPGRMVEPNELLQALADRFATGALGDKRVVVTAGPTWEALDPVRGMSNRSSGKMGFALAEAARDAGATVTLIAGPVSLPPPHDVRYIAVRSADDMLRAALAHATGTDVFIGAAAVADYRPAEVAQSKLKKQSERLRLELVRNPDIIAAIADLQPRPFMVGFAAETESLVAHARAKLLAKRLDIVIANDVSRTDSGIESDDNEVVVVDRHEALPLPRAPKSQLARQLIALIAERYASHQTQNYRSTYRE